MSLDGRGHDRAVLDDALVALCGTVLARRDGEPPTHAVRAAMRGVVDAARVGGTPPEQLLAQLKRCWAGLPAGRAMEAHDARDRLSEVVTLCIVEYFRPPGSVGGRADWSARRAQGRGVVGMRT
jgi:hypothetical protein